MTSGDVWSVSQLFTTIVLAMDEKGIKIGEIHTSLAIDGRTKDGPRDAAEELFSMINE
jgi:hypothetical protein